MMPNKLFDADTQVLPCALRTRLPRAGQLRRYVAWALRV